MKIIGKLYLIIVQRKKSDNMNYLDDYRRLIIELLEEFKKEVIRKYMKKFKLGAYLIYEGRK